MATTLATDVRLSIAHQTRFALRLASTISSNPKSAASNAAFSPVSLYSALSLLAAGAGSATRDQLVATLGTGKVEGLHALAEQVVQFVLADASSTGGSACRFANGVFVDASLLLKPSFQEIAVCKYKAETQSVDFQTKAAEVTTQVNSWVEKVTSGRIKDILPPGSIDNTTKLVLANALYFKGAWTEQFDSYGTKNDYFYLLDGSSVQTPFMSSMDDQYLLSSDGLKVLKLPYKQGGDNRQFFMYILLPEAPGGLSSLAEKLSAEPDFLERHIPRQRVALRQFKLPKFKISFGIEASDLLKCLGLQLPFGDEADFSEMVDSLMPQGLRVSSVFHQAFVEVNEQGTEAAASTAIKMVLQQARPPSVMDFIADHPFLFLVREDISGVVLFMGHVVNPLLSS
ncbi:serpin-Z1A-like [Triticum aestivum]|uniref:Serpin-Z1A n=1 Tax=Triticum aestivum TaxID=4565 RepID=SPZ1A_WHEAT|nr:serpin-Z1A [Triticum aestivum]Q41593.1 RecName: Full=Serpin-Z1A; AltName: Full=TriaeZ1a; AltName: Full=WSZ1a; Short=WSZ1; AltName: Full=WSZCI [Triticum aestivum]CAA90071.1 serpin [Triticum aestivum]